MNFDILIFWLRNQNKHAIINQERTVRFLNPIKELAEFQAVETLKWTRKQNSDPYIKDIKKTILNIRKKVESSMKYITVANHEYSKRKFLR